MGGLFDGFGPFEFSGTRNLKKKVLHHKIVDTWYCSEVFIALKLLVIVGEI